MENCIFCKINEKKIPAEIVSQTENTLTFLDIMPIKKGHVLVIPKAHYENLMETPDEILKEIVVAVKKGANAVKKATGADGISIINRNRRSAGQEVDHLHIHIVPRHPGDGLKSWHGGKYADGEIKEYGEKLRNVLNKNTVD